MITAKLEIGGSIELADEGVREDALKFSQQLPTPNAETLAALDEVRRMKKDPTRGKAYTDIDLMMKDLLSSCTK